MHDRDVELRTGWRRLSPVALVFFTGQLLRRLVTDGLPVLAPAAAGLATFEADRRVWIYAGLALLGVAILAYAIASYLRFRYRFDRRRVLISRGVFQRENLSVDFSRIQNLNLREPFYARWFSLIIVGIDTAGSSGKEITLGGIPRDQATALRDAVGRHSDAVTPAGDDAHEENLSHRVLVRLGSGDLIRYGLSHNSLFWLAVAAIALGQLAEGWAERFSPERLFSWWHAFAGLGWMWDTLLVIIAAALVVGLLAGFSVVGAVLRFHRYVLTRTKDGFVRRSGLLTRREQAIKAHKIQAVEISQNALARRLGRVNVTIRQAAAGVTGQEGLNREQRASRFVVPAVDRSTAECLLGEFLPDASLQNLSFSRPDRRYIRKTLLLEVGIPLAVFAAIPALLLSPWFAMLWPIGMLLAWPAVHQVWRRLGYGVVGRYAYFRRGFVGSSVLVFPLFKLQRFDLDQSPFQRRRNLGSMRLQLASHAVSMPYVPIHDAQVLRDLALYHAESSRERWI